MEDNSDMPSPTQEFCLKWNNFQASLVTAIDGFKNDLEFVDVTIACEGRLLKAHKMLLSACSIFFRDIFKDVTQHQHPVIILPGEVKFHDLEKILTFIYQGEVNVHQENLPRFLKTAEMLKIRGLAEDNEKRTLRSTVSPKAVSKNGNSASKRRKIYDGQSTSGNELFKTVDDCSRPLIGDTESDTEMVPVKQEMVELKEIDFESTDAESFIAEALLKEVAPTPSSSSCLQAQSSAPPPPGPLMPSYIPPAQIKNQDDSEIEMADEMKGFPFDGMKGRSKDVSEENVRQDEVCILADTPKPRHSRRPTVVPKQLTISPVSLDCSHDSLQMSRPSSAKFSNGKSPGVSHLSSGSSPGQMFTNLSKSPAAISPGSSNQSSLNTTPLSVSIWHPQAHSSPDNGSPGNTPGSSHSGSHYKCDICSKTFTSRSNLNKHRRVIHAGEEYLCPYCQRSFKNRYYIKDHINLCFSGKKAPTSQVFVADDAISNPETVAERRSSQGENSSSKKDVSPTSTKTQERKVLQFNML